MFSWMFLDLDHLLWWMEPHGFCCLLDSPEGEHPDNSAWVQAHLDYVEASSPLGLSFSLKQSGVTFTFETWTWNTQVTSALFRFWRGGWGCCVSWLRRSMCRTSRWTGCHLVRMNHECLWHSCFRLVKRRGEMAACSECCNCPQHCCLIDDTAFKGHPLIQHNAGLLCVVECQRSHGILVRFHACAQELKSSTKGWMSQWAGVSRLVKWMMNDGKFTVHGEVNSYKWTSVKGVIFIS